MELACEAFTPMVVRYWIVAHLGPWSRLLLVDPKDGTVVASWRTEDRDEVVRGVWISPRRDLAGVVEGIELEVPGGLAGHLAPRRIKRGRRVRRTDRSSP